MEYIIDNNTYILSKDKNKNDVTNHQVHDVLFKLLEEFDRVCRKNNVGYALAFGSALGIYNYQGFIPWDDDIDIVIDYFDRFKLIEALEKDLGEDFAFECYERDDRYNILIPAIKVRYKPSHIKEKNHFRLPNRVNNSDGVFIDITYLMGVPNNEKEHKRMLRKSWWKMPGYVILDALFHINPKKLKIKMKKAEENWANKYKDSEIISQSVIMPFQIYPKKKYHHISFPKEVIYPFKEYVFNGKKYYSFNKLKEFCILMYGERSLKKEINGQYVDPFPIKKRKSDHLILVDIEKNI